MESRRPAGLTRSLEATLHQACTTAVEQAEAAREGFRRLDDAALTRADAAGMELRQRARALTLETVAELKSRARGEAGSQALLALPGHLERLAEHMDSLVVTVRRVRDEGLPFTDRARREIAALGDMTVDVLTSLRDLVRTWNPVLARHLVETADRAEALSDECASGHRDRLIQGDCLPHSPPAFLAVLDHLSSIRRHARETALDLTRHPSSP
jgi:Na+/phosphate symporter